MGFFCRRKMDTKYIYEILTKDITSFGYYIWGIEFFGRQTNQTLRIYIDSEKGISIEDCEKVSKHVIKVLDAENDFSSKYLLEVSSPGLDRKFFFNEQYEGYINSDLKVKFMNDSGSKKSFQGELTKVTPSDLFLESEKESVKVPFSSIIQANLIM